MLLYEVTSGCHVSSVYIMFGQVRPGYVLLGYVRLCKFRSGYIRLYQVS